jgi:hypothetical protein
MVPDVESRILEHDQTGDGDPPLVLLPGGLTGWLSWLPLPIRQPLAKPSLDLRLDIAKAYPS